LLRENKKVKYKNINIKVLKELDENSEMSDHGSDSEAQIEKY